MKFKSSQSKFAASGNPLTVKCIESESGGGEGCILNNKSEYDRCRIPRLIVEELDEEQLNKEEEQELAQKISSIDEQTAECGSRLFKEMEQEDKKNEEQDSKNC